MTDVSLNFRENTYYAEERGGIPICLITIDHADFVNPIRISTDPTQRLVETVTDIIYGTISRGVEYYFFPCKLKLPDDKDDGPGSKRIQFANVNREYVSLIRSISGPLRVNTEMVLSNAPDAVDAPWPEFLLRSITYNAMTITGEMHMETLETEPYPAGSFLPSTSPSIFRI